MSQSNNARLNKLRQQIIDQMTPAQRKRHADFVNGRRHIPPSKRLSELEKLVASMMQNNPKLPAEPVKETNEHDT
jgi:hypothetical protein